MRSRGCSSFGNGFEVVGETKKRASGRNAAIAASIEFVRQHEDRLALSEDPAQYLHILELRAPVEHQDDMTAAVE